MFIFCGSFWPLVENSCVAEINCYQLLTDEIFIKPRREKVGKSTSILSQALYWHCSNQKVTWLSESWKRVLGRYWRSVLARYLRLCALTTVSVPSQRLVQYASPVLAFTTGSTTGLGIAPVVKEEQFQYCKRYVTERWLGKASVVNKE